MRAELWESTLAEYLTASEKTIFTWGENDCCLWVAKFVDAITGSNIATDWIGQYSTQEEAQAFMESQGFTSPEEIADHHLSEMPITKVGRGDIVLHPQGALGICAGRKSYFLIPVGLTTLNTLQCHKAWGV
jgi:hypothetical protein